MDLWAVYLWGYVATFTLFSILKLRDRFRGSGDGSSITSILLVAWIWPFTWGYGLYQWINGDL